MLLVPSSVNGDLATLNASGQVIDSGVSINNSGLTSASLWNAAKLAVTTIHGLLEQIQYYCSKQIDQQLLMFYMWNRCIFMDWNGTLYISLIGAKVQSANNKNFYHKYGCFRFSHFFNKRSFCILFCINIYYNSEWEGTSTGTVN